MAVTIKYGTARLRLKSGSDNLPASIRDYFGLPSTERFALVDRFGADVVVDRSLIRGEYELILPGSLSQTRSPLSSSLSGASSNNPKPEEPIGEKKKDIVEKEIPKKEEIIEKKEDEPKEKKVDQEKESKKDVSPEKKAQGDKAADVQEKKDSPDDVRFEFNLTGFGEFQGVKENPSDELMKTLPDFFKTAKLPKHIKINSFTTLETSGKGSKETFERLRHTHPTATKIWLHLGVNGSASQFAIEAQGWNEADFRVPDQRGWAPRHQEILGDAKMCMQSTLAVDVLVKEMKKQGYPVYRSNDPGRFVCNWIYFVSLCRSAKDKTHSLFVHIPPLMEISLEEQQVFVKNLIEMIAKVYQRS